VIGFGMGGNRRIRCGVHEPGSQGGAIAYSRNLRAGALSLGRPISASLMVDDIVAPDAVPVEHGDTSPSRPTSRCSKR
jgi:hypothetical protein